MAKNSLEEKYELIIDTIKKYPDQLKQAWDEINAMELPPDFGYVVNVVVCGMGGSALGARMGYFSYFKISYLISPPPSKVVA